MCHQSVGLVANILEGAGMSTFHITVRPDVTQETGVPRAARVRFPMGNPVGEPGKPEQQRRILAGALEAMHALEEPGHILELPFRWRRME